MVWQCDELFRVIPVFKCQQNNNKYMGSSLTTDKHGTSLEDWIQIQDNLLEIQFNGTSNTHLMVWKIFMDEIDHSITTLPVLLLNSNNPLLSNEDAYVVGLVKKDNYEGDQYVDAQVNGLLAELNSNIGKKSLQTYIKKGVVELTEENERIEYFTYAFLGKRSKINVKLAAISYCNKLATILSNGRRAKIMTGGGVYRNKKLQIGSVLSLCKSKSPCENSLGQYRHIHLVSQLIGCSSIQESMADDKSNTDNRFSLFSYKPKLEIPGIPVLSQSKIKSVSREEKDSIISQSSHENKKNGSNTQINKNKPVHVPAIKPPMLKLALKPYEQITYQQLEQEQKNQKFDIRATARHEFKMQKYGNDCSLIIQGLYLSGQIVAKDEDILKKHKITDIVNCAGDYCLNWFESLRNQENPLLPKYNYLTFFLKDSQNQNIECLFYRVIDFINSALSHGRNILIHCIQGISRSVTFVIAYLIFTNGYDYKKAESFVKDKRGIACPNNGFMVELIQFYKRLHEKYSSLPSPRAFLVSYHCQQTPDIVTARFIKQKLFEYDGKKLIGLDERGIYIIQTQEMVYLWVGSKCEDQQKMKRFWTYAQAYIKKLQEHEKAPMKIKAIHQGNEGRDFLSLWNLQELPKEYQNSDYDRLFNEQKPTPKAGYLRKNYQREEDNIEQQFISKLFIYPDYQNGLGVFELEDLCGLSLLVKSDNQKVKVFVWKAKGWDNEEEAGSQHFLDNVIKSNYASYEEQNIEIIEQQGGYQIQDLSEQFLSCFS